jgi:hypothetical protein
MAANAAKYTRRRVGLTLTLKAGMDQILVPDFVMFLTKVKQ